MTKLLLALDFGGTKHAAAVVAPGERNFQDCRRALSPPGADAGTDLDIMRSLAREVLGGEEPLAIGVSFGGPVDATTGTVRLSHVSIPFPGFSWPKIFSSCPLLKSLSH